MRSTSSSTRYVQRCRFTLPSSRRSMRRRGVATQMWQPFLQLVVLTFFGLPVRGAHTVHGGVLTQFYGCVMNLLGQLSRRSQHDGDGPVFLLQGRLPADVDDCWQDVGERLV
ncbi:hypothetical protein HPB49_016729 [Dermacentor silvarum]|uniref:Uncharacterized protein n=1 Tax=Dermacentor silvarum TaxID=543639 RepID=A0ACB8D713_DERSI|nr:hypothetical protein HPB49_016729 [Dermacentor silvarum]